VKYPGFLWFSTSELCCRCHWRKTPAPDPVVVINPMATAPDPVVVVNPMAAEVDRKVLATPATICLASCYLLRPLRVFPDLSTATGLQWWCTCGRRVMLWYWSNPNSRWKFRLIVVPLLVPLAIQDLFYSQHSWKLGFCALVSRSRLQNWGLFCLNPNPFHTVRRVQY